MQGVIRIMRTSPELFREILNRSISIVCPVRSMVNHDQFQTTDHVRICCGRVPALYTVIYGFLRSVAVDYGKKWNFWTCWRSRNKKIKTAEAWRLIPEHHGHVYRSGTDVPRIIPDKNRDASGVQTVKVWTGRRRAFSVAGPTAWNSLPDYLRDPSLSEDTFRRSVNTILFALY